MSKIIQAGDVTGCKKRMRPVLTICFFPLTRAERHNKRTIKMIISIVRFIAWGAQ
jgi:hypothetical protein